MTSSLTKHYVLQVTNQMGIEWVRRHLARRGIRVHQISFRDSSSMHIDASFNLIGPGLALYNPDRPCKQHHWLVEKGWKLLSAPEPTTPPGECRARSSHKCFRNDKFLIFVIKCHKIWQNVIKFVNFLWRSVFEIIYWELAQEHVNDPFLEQLCRCYFLVRLILPEMN